MSHTVMQRVVVRMLYDPVFAAAVVREPERALAGLGLSAEARAQLAATDPRALATDPLRAHRTLTALLAEYPTSAAALCRVPSGLTDLEAFFSSAVFHAAIDARRSLALAFGDHLAALAGGAAGRGRPDPLAQALVGLERALCEARRNKARERSWCGGATIRLAAGAGVVAGPAGGLDAFRAYERALREADADPVAALLAPGLALPQVAVDMEAVETVLIEQRGDALTLELTTAELHGLLSAAAASVSRGELVAALMAEGLDRDEADELLDELVASGLLEQRAEPRE